jgi:hypothetical protein
VTLSDFARPAASDPPADDLVEPPPAAPAEPPPPPVLVVSVVPQTVDVARIAQDPVSVMKSLIVLPGHVLAAELSAINVALPGSDFLLQFLHNTGPRGSGIVQVFPNVTGAIGRVIQSRKAFAVDFPDYEGNFALTDFLKRNRENPVPVGTPPICVEAAKKLQIHVDATVSLLREVPTQGVAEEAFFAYQVTAFVLAKLKQANVATAYVGSSAVPLFRNQHDALKRAFSRVTTSLSFPAEPFNFDDPNFLKRIRPPASRSIEA